MTLSFCYFAIVVSIPELCVYTSSLPGDQLCSLIYTFTQQWLPPFMNASSSWTEAICSQLDQLFSVLAITAFVVSILIRSSSQRVGTGTGPVNGRYRCPVPHHQYLSLDLGWNPCCEARPRLSNSRFWQLRLQLRLKFFLLQQIFYFILSYSY